MFKLIIYVEGHDSQNELDNRYSVGDCGPADYDTVRDVTASRVREFKGSAEIRLVRMGDTGLDFENEIILDRISWNGEYVTVDTVFDRAN